MRSRKVLLAAGFATVLLAGGGTALAVSSSIPDSSGVIHGCYDSGGNVKVIDTSVTATCPKGYSSLDWNQTGPQGAAGAKGAQGSQGPAGPAGPASLDAAIGSPCDEGTAYAGTLSVTYTPQGDGTDSVSIDCVQSNPTYALNLTVNVPGDTECNSFTGCITTYGTISVTSSPGSISCGDFSNYGNFDGTVSGTCTNDFAGGTVVTLTAAAGSNSTLGAWTGCDSVSPDGTTCTVTMNAIRNVGVTVNYT